MPALVPQKKRPPAFAAKLRTAGNVGSCVVRSHVAPRSLVRYMPATSADPARMYPVRGPADNAWMFDAVRPGLFSLQLKPEFVLRMMPRLWVPARMNPVW